MWLRLESVRENLISFLVCSVLHFQVLIMQFDTAMQAGNMSLGFTSVTLEHLYQTFIIAYYIMLLKVQSVI